MKLKEVIRRHLNNFLRSSTFLRTDKNILLRNIDYMVNNAQKKDKVIYTCFTGNYDSLLLQSYIDNNFDYVCFTDSSDLLSYTYFGAWKIRPLAFSELDNTRNARWHKTHPHVLFPDYSESIWIDGNINLISDYVFNEIQKRHTNMLIPEHWHDDCIYKEIDNVMTTIVPEGGETKENVDKMAYFLKQHDFPKHYGLNETNFIYRKHNEPEIIKIMEEWWGFIRDFTKRDQLSLSYVLFKNGIKPNDISFENLRKKFNAVEFVQHKTRK